MDGKTHVREQEAESWGESHYPAASVLVESHHKPACRSPPLHTVALYPLAMLPNPAFGQQLKNLIKKKNFF